MTIKTIDGPLQFKDIWFDKVPLNDWTDDLVCLVTKVDGWWGPPEASVPIDDKPYTEDGSYMVPGRNLGRTVEIEGVCLPRKQGTQEGQDAVIKWRDNFVSKLNKVRELGTLTFFEARETKALKVQVRERPLFDFKDGFSDILEYNVSFYAPDPAKYSVATSRKVVKVSEETRWDIFEPNIEENVDSAVAKSSPGRHYHDTIVNGQSYGTFPRSYNQTGLYFNEKDNTYSSQITVFNAGDTTTYGNIVLHGPVTNPAIKHVEENKVLKLNIELTDTQTATIDLDTKEILLNDKDQTSLSATLDFNSLWFSFAPGINTLVFYGENIVTEQIGWSAATNYVKNSSVEYINNLQDVAVFTNIVNQIKDLNIQEKEIANYAPAINSSLSDEAEYSQNTILTNTTATLSSWYGSEYDEENKSVRISPVSSATTNTFVDIIPDTQLTGQVVFSVDRKASIDTSAIHGNKYNSIAIRYLNNKSVLYETISKVIIGSDHLEVFANIPIDATNVTYRIYNGYSLTYGLDVEDDTYKEFDNALFVKNIYIGTVLPISSDLSPYSTDDFLTADAPTSIEYINRNKHYIHILGDTDIKINSDYYKPLDANSSVITILASIGGLDTNAVNTTVSVTLKDPQGENLDLSYVLGSFSNTIKEASIRIEKPEYPVEIYLSFNPNIDTTPLKYEVSNIAIIEGRYYGNYFDNSINSLVDSSLNVGQYPIITQKKPYGYTPVLVAVDDLEEKTGEDSTLFQSTQFSLQGSYSLGLRSPQEPLYGFVEGARVDCIDWSIIPNGTVTVSAYIYNSGESFTTYTNQHCLGVKDGDNFYYSEQAVDNKLSLKFTKKSNNIKLYLLGGTKGSTQLFFDGIIVSDGDYNDRYFVGGLELTSWTGEENNSISIQEEKPYIQGSISEVYFRDAWIT